MAKERSPNSVWKKLYVFFAMLLFLFGLTVLIIPADLVPQDSELSKHYLAVSSNFDPAIITSINTDEKVIALTFDDGPDARYTPEVLKILAEYQVIATFFVVGEDATLNPDIIAEQIKAGHEVENHSFTHPDLLKKNDLTINEEILWCHEAIASLTGREPLYFRPPRGLYNLDIVKLAGIYGYQVVLWTVCLENRSAPTPKAMAERVVKKCVPGSIILAHDGRKNRSKSVEALPLLIKSLQKKGFHFVTLHQLLTEYKQPMTGNKIQTL